MNLSNKRLGKFTASIAHLVIPTPSITQKQLLLLAILEKKATRTDKQEAELQDLILKRDTPVSNTTRDKIIIEKAEEIVRGHAKRSIRTFDTDHGHLNEAEAGEKFSELTGLIVEYLEQEFFEINENSGSTPDFAVINFNREILASVDAKCPTETFYRQKLMFVQESKPEFQNVPKEMFVQGQMQMMSLSIENMKRGFGMVKNHYLVRYMTSSEIDDDGNKIEYDLPLESRMFWTKITADPDYQQMLSNEIEKASKERDLYVEIFRKPILQNP